ncbi:MAG: ATP synthase F0 subunit C [Candidatus Omnitrophica bacterium]|nr:ATP synthase F0 subunit C [Candidatus Omnitrophota bacterium]
MQSLTIPHIANISVAVGMGLSAVGAGIGVGLIFAAALSAIARQPEQAQQIKGLMFLGMAVVEGLAIMCAILSFFILFQ